MGELLALTWLVLAISGIVLIWRGIALVDDIRQYLRAKTQEAQESRDTAN